MPLSVDNSFAMWTLAWDARNRAVEGTRKSPGDPTGDTIATIIQAAASAEGFINELADAVRIEEEVNAGLLRQKQSRRYPVPPHLSSFEKEHANIENRHGHTTEKFVAAFEKLAGQSFRGTQFSQDFADLMRLRDMLMHLRTRDREGPVDALGGQEPTITIQPPEGRIKFIKRFMQKGLTRIEKDAIEVGTSWFNLIQTAKMANWACHSARAIILKVLDQIPDSPSDPSGIFKHDFRNRAEKLINESPPL
jgi:hypothetical protein